MGGQRHRGAMAEASTEPREGPCGLAVPPFLRRNGTVGFTLQNNHLLVPVEEGLKQRLVNQEHFTETQEKRGCLRQWREADMFMRQS